MMRLGIGESDEVLMLIAESEKEKQDFRVLHLAYNRPDSQITYVHVSKVRRHRKGRVRRYPDGARMHLTIDKPRG